MMKHVRRIARSAKKLARQSQTQPGLPGLNLAPMPYPISSDLAANPAQQAVEDSLVEIFDNVVSLVVRELQRDTQSEASETGQLEHLYPADRRKTLL